MENWFPSTTSVDLRNGYTLWQTGLPAWAESIFAYNGLATKKLFCAAGTAFYDVTAKAGTPSSVVTGLANARWQYTNVGTFGGQFLLCCNGVDTPYAYNGTTWQAITAVSSPLALTGNDPATATQRLTLKPSSRRMCINSAHGSFRKTPALSFTRRRAPLPGP
jgi:hypothetical protein